MSPENDDLKHELKQAKKEIEQLGGVRSLWKGHWLIELVQRSFKNYSERATAEYFRQKYPGYSNDEIAKKLTNVACKNAAWLGGLTGIAVSTDEIVAVATGGEGGVGLPANIAIFAGAAFTEAYVLAKIQVQLIANLAKLFGTPLDADDPEDIYTILEYAFGGVISEQLGKATAKAAKGVTKFAVRKYLSGETLQTLQKIARRIGMKLLQRTILKYAVPAASVLVGSAWNYYATKAVGKRAVRGFSGQAKSFAVSAEK